MNAMNSSCKGKFELKAPTAKMPYRDHIEAKRGKLKKRSKRQ